MRQRMVLGSALAEVTVDPEVSEPGGQGSGRVIPTGYAQAICLFGQGKPVRLGGGAHGRAKIRILAGDPVGRSLPAFAQQPGQLRDVSLLDPARIPVRTITTAVISTRRTRGLPRASTAKC